MKMRQLTLIVLLTFLLLAACGGAGEATPTEDPGLGGDPVAGKTNFEGTCSACHGMDAKGIEGLGKDLSTSTFVAENTDQELLDFILVGRPAGHELNTTGIDMPPKGGNPALDNEDIADIIAYLREINNP